VDGCAKSQCKCPCCVVSSSVLGENSRPSQAITEVCEGGAEAKDI
jgi:hypothetical protein